MRLRTPLHFTVILLWVAVALATVSGRASDVWPSRYVMTKVLYLALAASEDYEMAIFRPSESAEDYHLFFTIRQAPVGGLRSSIVIRDARGLIKDQINFVWRAALAAGRDVDGDGTNELIVMLRGDTTTSVIAYDWPDLKPLWEYVMNERDYRWRGTSAWETYIRLGPLIRRSDGSPLELLIFPAAGHGKMPKGIIALDPSSGTEIWHYWIGGSMEKAIVLDSISGDGSAIITGTYAADNGSIWQNTTDRDAYLFSLNLSGHELWKWARTGPFTGMMDNYEYHDPVTGERRLFVLFRCTGSDVVAESLYCVNPVDGEILRRRSLAFGHGDSYSLPWNRSSSGNSQFLVWNPDGGIAVYDDSLKLVRKAPDFLKVLGLVDLDRDGSLEIVAVSRHGSVALLDDDFTTLATYPVVTSGIEARFQWSPNVRYPFVWIGSKDEFIQLSVEKTPYYWPQITLRITVLLLAVTFLSWISVWGIRARLTVVRERRDRERRLAWATITSKLSHDIRTPISVLRLSGDNLEMEIEAEFGRVPEHIRKYFDVIRAETARTEDVANGLLKFSRELPPVREQVDLAALVRKTVEQHPHSPQIEVVTDVEPDFPMVTVDYRQMVSLIENLMSNSLKAMKNTGRLTVSLRQAQLLLKKKARNGFEIEVADTGRGIPPKDLPRIFEAYFSHSEGGTGLGLAIVKKIVEDHHGTISVRSTVGVGTTVTARIPFEQEAADEPAR